MAPLSHASSPPTGGQQGQYHIYGEGLPLPWPFPWARECPVKWSQLAGRYRLEASSSNDEIELKITVINTRGLRMIKIARFDENQQLLAQGAGLLVQNQRMVEVMLQPTRADQPAIRASLKLHFSDLSGSCEMSSLTPILTLQVLSIDEVAEIQYRLVRRYAH
jgi:hypothetical protein